MPIAMAVPAMAVVVPMSDRDHNLCVGLGNQGYEEQQSEQ